MNAPYLLQANGRLYPYSSKTMLLICLAENRKEGFEPEALYKLEPEGFGYAYVPTSEAEIKGETIEEIQSVA